MKKSAQEVIAQSLERQEPGTYDWRQWVDPIIADLAAEGYMIVDMDDHELTANLPQIAAARTMDRILSRGEF